MRGRHFVVLVLLHFIQARLKEELNLQSTPLKIKTLIKTRKMELLIYSMQKFKVIKRGVIETSHISCVL